MGNFNFLHGLTLIVAALEQFSHFKINVLHVESSFRI